jgi:hypothetical protein
MADAMAMELWEHAMGDISLISLLAGSRPHRIAERLTLPAPEVG